MKKEALPYLNLGCGKKFDRSWVNVDMVATDPEVIVHNLFKQLPYPDGSFQVVYHSHVLEHLPKSQAGPFIRECYRLLEKGGVLRVVVPDLEKIVRNYLQFLEKNLENPTEESAANYEWTMMEMYDQVVRTKSGGEMNKFLQRKDLPNRDFIVFQPQRFRRSGTDEIPVRQVFAL